MHLELMICTCSSYLKGNFFWEPSPKKSTLLYHHHLWPKIFCIRRSSLLAFTSLSNAQSNKRSSCKHVQCILAKGHTQLTVYKSIYTKLYESYMSQHRCCIVWNNTRKVIETLYRLANMNQNPIAKKRLQIFPKAKMTSNKNAHTFWQYFLAHFFVPFQEHSNGLEC